MGRCQTTADSRKPSKTGELASLETALEELIEVVGFAIRAMAEAMKTKKMGYFQQKARQQDCIRVQEMCQ